ncbi:response regulator [Nitratidesulfovibrio liaohensis]|uniref:Response regulator n=1 Tax=Nitratidesulfovibrio liaohensis TaxID=2604158 RepID=A0ABY9R077_9BACT|nr:response regulator [Nitratidesulfovibrio liaohensis]WMW64726.1 response regulator [Nitratidesulfovibrio liaohensis]
MTSPLCHTSAHEPPIDLLIVDDEESIRRLLMAYFEDFDAFSVRAAASGEEALETLAVRHADLCVVDMRLPGMNGEQFILEAAGRAMCRHFLVHTGSVNMKPGQALRAAGVGQEDVLVKPHDAARLAERIHHVLGRHGAHDTPPRVTEDTVPAGGAHPTDAPANRRNPR